MVAGCDVRTYLGHEARALLTRLSHVQPFSLHETMVPAASPSPAAIIAIERYLAMGKRALHEDAKSYLALLEKAESCDQAPEELHRGLTLLRLRFNVILSELDIFAQAFTQRSGHTTGVWLAGLDAVADDAMQIPGGRFEAPPVMCYLERGFGAAIRRVQTRLPGGGRNPVAIIRVPRERMVGCGIGASLVHEVGHQVAAMLDVLPSLREALRGAAPSAEPAGTAWRCFERWISEIFSDLWAVATLGPTATLGLMAVVNLPRAFVFRANATDPHPTPWLRVKLSCALGERLFPSGAWGNLVRLWESLYPLGGLPEQRVRDLEELAALLPEFANLVVEHTPPRLEGAKLLEVLPHRERQPAALDRLFTRWRRRPALMREARPTLALAVLGQARMRGLLTPEEEGDTIGLLLNNWALRSSLGPRAGCAVKPRMD